MAAQQGKSRARYREQPCFLHFTSLHRFRSRSTTHFQKEITGVHVLTKHYYKFSVITAEKSIAKCGLKASHGRLSGPRHYMAEI